METDARRGASMRKLILSLPDIHRRARRKKIRGV